MFGDQDVLLMEGALSEVRQGNIRPAMALLNALRNVTGGNQRHTENLYSFLSGVD
jgi:hypothetical protein